MELIPDGAQIRLRFQWPAQYLNRVQFASSHRPTWARRSTKCRRRGRWRVRIAQHVGLIVSTPLFASHFYLLYLTLR